MKYPIINQEEVNSTIKHLEERLKNINREEKPYEAAYIIKHINHLRNLESELCKYYVHVNEKMLVDGARKPDIFILTFFAKMTINKLLGDTKIRKSLVFIDDGSYIGNRIWLYMNHDGITDVQIEVDRNLISASDLSIYNTLSTKKKIDWIYNHFDKVFVQLPPEWFRLRYLNYLNSLPHKSPWKRQFHTSCEAMYMDN